MALWLCRAGKHGQFEQRFLSDKRIYLTWDGLNRNLGSIETKPALGEGLREVYPDAPKARISQNTGQIWAFVKGMSIGDWVALPSKVKAAIHIAEITGDYSFDPKAADPFYHHRTVKWIAEDIPRSNFDQDLLYSLGAFSTVCRIRRNDAENRVHKIAASAGVKLKPRSEPAPVTEPDDESDEPEVVDLERLARDSIAKLITAHYSGHAMAALVEAVLRAQGYTTYRSPEGPDKGIDILAGGGLLGFGAPRIAVQVKSGSSPVDRPTLDQLIGAMQNVHADHGLLVSWGGFKSSVDREEAIQFFRVRLWDQDTLMDQILANYDKLDDDLRAELPLKRIWTVAEQEDGD
ncbi:MAG: restriction endonuclease [Planctomycetaceae bacterium]|nr:restriction endonuclease [Planctomycetaceae bacterium]